VTLAELRSACEALPFLAQRRLVIVTGLLTRLESQEDDQFMQVLLDLLPGLPHTTRLVFVEKRTLSGTHPVVKLARKTTRGYVRQFDPPSGGALPGWIGRRVHKHGGRIADDAAARLAHLVGADLRLLNQEILKLVTYAGERQITSEDVDLLVPYAQEVIIFDLVDALGQRDGGTAAGALQRLLDTGEHPMGILAMIVRQFRLLVQVKELRQAGQNARTIARLLDLHPYPAGKLYRQATNFTAAQLEKIYRHLLVTDAQIKTGALTPIVALDLLVAGLAEPDA
jgi:DNA polymerase-3 subunit delta